MFKSQTSVRTRACQWLSAALIGGGLWLAAETLESQAQAQPANYFHLTAWKTNEAGAIVTTNYTQNGFARFTVTLGSGFVAETVPPDPQFVSLFLNAGYIRDGSDLAQPNQDYTPVSVTGPGTFLVSVPLFNDSSAEFNEDILLRIRPGSQPANQAASVDIATITIEVDDPPGGGVDLFFTPDPPYNDSNLNPGANSFVQAVAEGFTNRVLSFTSNNVDTVLNRLNINNHGLPDGLDVFFLQSTNLPNGVTTNTQYLVTNATANTFGLLNVASGAVVNFNSEGGGTNQLVGRFRKIYVGGDFTSINGVPNVKRFARLNDDGSVDSAFAIGDGADAFVAAIAVQPDEKVIIGGGFGSVNGVVRSGIARLLTNGLVDATFNPGIGAKVGSDVGAVRTVAIYTNGIHAGKVIVGGDFTSYNGTNRGSIIRLNADGSLDAGFSTAGGADGPVYSARIQADGKVVIGGDFTHVDGVPRNRIARLTINGALDETFNPGTGADNTVFAVGFDRTSPTTVVNRQATGGQAEDRLTITAPATSGVLTINYDFLTEPDIITVYYPPKAQGGAVIFSTGLTNGVATVAVPFAGSSTQIEIVVNEGGSSSPTTIWSYDAIITGVAGAEKILIGGAFGAVDLRSRNRIARLAADGSLDTTYNPGTGFNDVVYTIDMEPYTGKAVVGGLFTAYNMSARTNLARLYPNGSLDTSFMDTAYNAYAGPTNNSFFVNSFVNALVVQTDGKVVIGGAFTGVGGDIGRLGVGTEVGGKLYVGTSLGAAWPGREPEPNDFLPPATPRERETGGTGGTRWGVRNRNNLARVIGGVTFNEFGELGGPGQLEFSSPVYTVNEFGTNAVLTIRRTNGSLGTVSISFATSNLTATAGQDYTATSDTRTWRSDYLYDNIRMFSSGDITNKNFMVSALNDSLVEGDENLLLSMFNPGGFQALPTTNIGGIFFSRPTASNIVFGAAIGFQSQSTLTIIDDDFSFGAFNFSSTNYVVNEGDGAATITVTRTGGSVGSVSVKYSTVLGGTAAAGSDYTSVTNTLTFSSGQTARTFSVPIINEAAVEFDETVLLILANPTGGATLGSVTNATLTIYDNDNGLGSLSLTTNSYSVAENGANAVVMIQRTSGNAGTVTVQFQTSDGTATDGIHYTGISTNLTFGNGITSQTVLVPIADDALPNADRTVNLTLSLPGGGAQLGGQTNAVLTIINEDFYGSLSFSSSSYFVGEPDTNALITVIRTGGSAGTVTVDYNTANGTAFAGLDYTNSFGTLAFASGEVSKTFQVGIINDTALEQDETVAVSLFNFVNATPGTVTNAVLTIADDETLNFPAGTDDTGFGPNPGPNGFVFSLAVQPNRKLLVGGAFTFFNGTSRNRIARVESTGALDTGFSPGTGANGLIRSVVLQPDGRVLIGGQFTVYNTTNRNYIARLNVDGTLDATFNPGAGADNPIFAVALNTNGTVLVAGDFTTMGGFARNRIALLNTNGAMVAAFNPGTGADNTIRAAAIHTNGTQSSKVVIGGDFTTINGLPNNRIARLNLADGSVDTGFSQALGTGVTNGVVHAVAIQTDGRILVGGVFTNIGGAALTNIARLNADGSIDSTFTAGTGPNNAVFSVLVQTDGKILIGGDFTSVGGVGRNHIARLNPDGSVDPSINFGSGADSFVATLTLRPDARIILGGGFTHFNGVTRNYLEQVIGGSTPGAGTLEYSSATYSATESNPSAAITVTRVGGTESVISVNFATIAGGSATVGADYASTNGILFFGIGETSHTFTVPLLDDTAVDGNKTVLLRLSNATNVTAGVAADSLLGAKTNATLTILDDDSVISFSASSYSISEAGGAATITVVRTGGTVGPVTVRVFTTDGTATAGLDYTGFTNTLSFASGETSRTFAIPILDESLVEGNETVAITLTNATGTAVLGPNNSVTLTIVDNDFAQGMLSFSAGTYGVNENDGLASITVLRGNGTSGTITVNFATSDGTAANGVFPAGDYTATNGILTFADGESAKVFTVRIHPDFIATETNETVNLSLSNPSGGATLGSQSVSTLVITNNNDFIFGSLRFSTNAFSVNENGGSAAIEVWLVGRTTNTPITVTYATLNGTATEGSDYTGVTNTLTFAAGETNKAFTVPIIDEFPQLAEGDETVLLTLSNPVGGAGLVAPSTATLAIVDDDFLAGAFTFSTNNFSANEISTNAIITVLRTNGSTGTVTVDFATSEGTARNGVDYTNTSGTLTFADGVTSANFLVPLIHNPLQRGNFTVLLALSNPTAGASISQGNAVLTILDNEPAAGSPDSTFTGGAGADDTIYALQLRQATGNLFIGGDFTRFDGQIRTNMARLNADGTLDGSFDPGSLNMNGTNASVRALAVYTNGLQTGKVVIGGLFNSIDGTSRNFVARLNVDGSLDSTFNPGVGANNLINAVLVQNNGSVIVGGAFTSIGGTNRNFIARLNDDGSVDDTFDPGTGPDAPVRVLAADPNGLILVGGDFSSIADVVVGRIGRLKPDGGVDKTFDGGLGANESVRAIAILNNGQILIGGRFTTVDGANLYNRIARLNPDGSVDTSFMASLTGVKGVDDFVSALAIQSDGKILLGGGFTTVNGVTNVNRIARLDADGALDPTFNTGGGANDFVSSLALQSDGKVVLAGAFTEFNGAPHNRIVRLHGGDNVGSGNLSYTSSAYTVAENGLYAVVSVQRSRGTTNRVSVDYTTSNGSALAYPGSGPVAGYHYTNAFGTLVFEQNETLKSFLVPIIDNTNVFGNTTVNLSLFNPTNYVAGVGTNLDGSLLGSLTNAVLTIIDDDGIIGFAAASYNVNEDAGTATVTLLRVGGVSRQVSVDFRTADDVTNSHPALAGFDYVGTTNTLTFLPGQTSASISIPIFNDTLTEGNETVKLLLYNPTNVILGLTNATLTLIDDEFQPGVLLFSTNNYEYSEGITNAVITVLRTNGTTGAVSVKYSTSDGTAQANLDYQSVNSTLSFADGESVKTFVVPMIDDPSVDSNELETVNLILSNPSGGAALAGMGPFGVPDPVFNLSSGPDNSVNAVVLQPDGRLLIGGLFGSVDGVVLNGVGRLTANGSVDVTFNPGAGVNGSVLAMGLYTSGTNSGRVVIGGNFTTFDATNTANRLARLNADGSLDTNFNIGTGVNNTIRALAIHTAGTNAGKVVIGGDFNTVNGTARNRLARLNPDGSLDATFNNATGFNGSIRALAIQPDGAVVVGGTFTTFTNATFTNTTVQRIARFFADGSFDGLFSTNVNLGPNTTVNAVAVQSDGGIVIAGAFTNVNGVARNYIARLGSDGTLDPAFDPGVGVNAAINSVAVQPDGLIVIAGGFTMNNGVSRNGIDRLTVSGGRDTSFDPGAGADAAVNAIVIQPDTQIVIGGDFTMFNGTPINRIARLQAGAAVGLALATLTIVDNDVAIGFSTNNFQVSENALSQTVTVTRSGLTNLTFVVDFTTLDGTAFGGLDYLSASGSLTFGPNETLKTFDVALLNDAAVEGNEFLNLQLTAMGGANLTGLTTAMLTILDDDTDYDLVLGVDVMEPVYVTSNFVYTVSVTNLGPSAVTGVTLTNALPPTIRFDSQTNSLGLAHVQSGNVLTFDLGTMASGAVATFGIFATATNPVSGLVTNTAAILPITLGTATDSNTSNNVSTNSLLIRDPSPFIAANRSLTTVTNESRLPANGAIDPGETVTLNLALQNIGIQNTAGSIGATLLATNGVVSPSGSVDYGSLPVGQSAVRAFTFTANGTNGQIIVATFQLTDSGVFLSNNVVRVPFTLGAATNFANTDAIIIPEAGPALQPNYPSTITVSNLNGIVGKLSVTLSNLTHSYPADLDLLLVSPSGEKVLFMSDAGGALGNGVTNVTITLDDEAAVRLPDSSKLTNGTYRPYNYDDSNTDAFPAPAPAAPYASNLAAFNGIDPNGTWSLYVVDDSDLDFGAISNGWSLNIIVINPVSPTVGLSLSMTASTNAVYVGDTLLYALVVTNIGPDAATSVKITNALPAGVSFVAATNSSGGSFAPSGNTVVFDIGTLAKGQAATNYLAVVPRFSGTVVNQAVVSSAQTDPYPPNNSASLSVTAVPSANLLVSLNATNFIAFGANLTNVITVRNLGPSTATGILLTSTFPASATFVAGSSSQGFVSAPSSNVITASLGNLASNSAATVTIVSRPNSVGDATNTASVGSAVFDANTTNNSSSLVTTVGASADLAVSMVSAPDPVVVTSNLTYTIAVTNLGQSTATNVVVADTLSGSLTFVSVSASQGSATYSGGTVTCNLGTLATGVVATVTIQVKPNAAGPVNNTAVVSASTPDPSSANNSATVTTTVNNRAIEIVVAGSTLLNETNGVVNGAVDPGETVTFAFGLRNKGGSDTTNLVATLLGVGNVITNSPQSQSYGVLTAGGAAKTTNFTFTAGGSYGDTLVANLQLQDISGGVTNSLGTLTFSFPMGVVNTFSNTAQILILDDSPAAPYPSVIGVSNIAGTVIKVSVTLSNLTHSFPDDIDVLLESPSGQSLILMSDTGGGFGVGNLTLTFDGDASSFLPDAGAMTNGTYKPSNFLDVANIPSSTNDTFAAPAPQPAAGTGYATDMSVLKGLNPNGAWKLYVMDDSGGDTGLIADGWSLRIVSVATVNPSVDLAVSLVDVPALVSVGSNVTYTAVVTNSGPNTATNVVLTNFLSANIDLLSTNGAAASGTGPVIFNIGTLLSGAKATNVMVISPTLVGSVSLTSVVSSAQIELTSINNTATVVITVDGVQFNVASNAVTTNGSFQLNLLGHTNKTYVIEVSTNLVNWTPIFTNTTLNGALSFVDTNAPNFPSRFYRAVEQ